jgi:AI-2 transport protein TqsA
VSEPVGIGKPLPHTLNSLFTSLLPPYLVGDAVGLSITVTLISVVFWAWVLGPLGAVLAIPHTLLMKSVFVDADPRAVWAATLIGSTRSEARRSFRRTRVRRTRSCDHP